MSDPKIRITPGGSMEALGHGETWQSVPRDAQAEIERLRKALYKADEGANFQHLYDEAKYI